MPSGQLISTAEDLAQYLIAPMNEGYHGQARVVSCALGRVVETTDGQAGQAAHIAKEQPRSRWRSARHTARAIGDATRRSMIETVARCRQACQKLVDIARVGLRQAQATVELLHQVATEEAEAIAQQVEQFLP